jgi:hypothetical protein
MMPAKRAVFLRTEPSMLPGGRVYDLIGQPLEFEPGRERRWTESLVRRGTLQVDSEDQQRTSMRS